MSRTAPKSSPPAKEPRLTEQAVAGSILEASGATAEEMARKLGCATATVHRWRKNPEYRALVNGHRAKTEAAIRDDLLDVRRTVLDGVTSTAKAASALVHSNPDDLEVVSKAGKLLLDLWRAIAAQTGITEASTVEIAVSPPEEARQLLRAELKTLTTEELRALQAKGA